MTFPARPLAGAVLFPFALLAHAQTTTPAPTSTDPSAVTLPAVKVEASADASAQGLSPPFAGGQVARGGRAGILGTRDNLETPFSITSYTNELIQDKQARSVGEVLLNDPTVRTARGFGNFQESYFIRGFLLASDDVAYNGLYSLLPRQYIATELFERVELLRGASTFLTGANPGGDGIGGAINLLPKRAGNKPLNQVTLGLGDDGQYNVATDLSRRFGPDGSTGVRFNAAYRDGGTGIDDEKAKLGLVAIGLDWRSRDVRLSGDLGYQDNQLKRTRTNVSLLSSVTGVPDAPRSDSNWAQPWTYSNERDLFGTLRGEWDINPYVTAWGAYGLRRSDEKNSLANLDVADSTTGDGSTSRFDNTREDEVDTGELGLRGKFMTGSVGHEWVLAASYFRNERKNAYIWDYFNTLATNLYNPVSYPQPPFTSGAFAGGDMDNPGRTGRTKLVSYAIGDTMAFLDGKLLVTVGVRDQTFEVENFAYGTGDLVDKYDKSHTAPLGGVVWRVTPEVSLYGNYVEGLSAGETAPFFGTPPPVNAGQQLAPYVSKQVEFGGKYETARLGGGLALFQTKKPRAYVNSEDVFTSSGEDRHRGVELTVYGVPVDRVRVLGGFTWLDAVQQKTGSDATDGKRVIGVPRDQGSIGVEWDLPYLEGFTLDNRIIYSGSSYADALNTLRVPGWTRWDLGARYYFDVKGKAIAIRARVDNVTNKDYWASVGGYPGQGYLVAGGPRTFALSASFDF